MIEGEVQAATSDPATHALEVAHALAFRSGLGSSLFAPSHNSITVEDIKQFAASAFTKGNIAVLGTGIDQSTLAKLIEKSLASAPASAPPTTSASSYFGGETRVEAHGGLQTVFIGFGSTGAPSAELAALAAHLSPQPSVKWSQGLSPIAASLSHGTSVQSVYLPYSDATLVGLLVQGPTAAGVKEAGRAAVKALQGAATVSAEDLKKAVVKAKFAAASSIDSRDGLVSVLGSRVREFVYFLVSIAELYLQVLAGSDATLNATLSSLDQVSAPAFSKVSILNHQSKYTI